MTSRTRRNSSKSKSSDVDVEHQILGSGASGIVLYPPMKCNDVNINYSEYVGKISTGIKIKKLIDSYENMKFLPDEFNNIAYKKNSYICKFDVKPTNSILPTSIQFPCVQLIIPKIGGETVLTLMEKYAASPENDREYMDLLVAAVLFYDVVVNMTNKKVYYNDHDVQNIMYDAITHQMMLIDLDDMTLGTKHKYAGSPNVTYKTHVVYQILNCMVNYDYFEDEDILQDKAKCKRRESVFIKYGVLPCKMNKFPENGFVILKQNLHSIYNEICSIN